MSGDGGAEGKVAEGNSGGGEGVFWGGQGRKWLRSGGGQGFQSRPLSHPKHVPSLQALLGAAWIGAANFRRDPQSKLT